MKKILILLLAVPLFALSACGSGNTPAATPTPAETPAPTPTPDFSGTDFSGRWQVAEIIDSNGAAVDEAKKQELDAGFTLELLPDGTYFVYDESGMALGQGEYGVTLNEMVLRAEDEQTAYEIVDSDTLRITQPDASVTVMRRVAETCADTDEGGVIDDGSGNGGDDGDPEAASSPAGDAS